MSQPDPLDRARLTALAAAATPGPWIQGKARPSDVLDMAGGYIVAAACSTPTLDGRSLSQRAHDQAAFIAAANPQAVLALLASRDDLAGQVTRLTEAAPMCGFCECNNQKSPLIHRDGICGNCATRIVTDNERLGDQVSAGGDHCKACGCFYCTGETTVTTLRGEVARLTQALEWVTHIMCGVSKGGGSDISQQEYNEAVDAAKLALRGATEERTT